MKQNDNHNKTTFGKKHGGQQLKWPGNKREVKTIEIRLIEEGKEKFLLSVGVFALNMRRAYEDNRVQKWHGSDKIVYVKRKRANCLLAFLFIGVPTCQNNTHGQDLFFYTVEFWEKAGDLLDVVINSDINCETNSKKYVFFIRNNIQQVSSACTQLQLEFG